MGSIPSDGSSSSSPPHAILFPFMAKGHTVPLLHFARILLRRDMAVTVFTTAANRPFVAKTLEDTAATIIDLPFPTDIADIPAGIESTENLPSMSLLYKYATATSLMQPHFERVVETLPRVSFMVSDAFLWWTLDSATKFGFPRLVSYGMSSYSHAVTLEAFRCGIASATLPPDELVTLTRFPWIRLSKNEFDPIFLDQESNSGISSVLFRRVRLATLNSYGRIVNSFYELEPLFTDYLNRESSPMSWCVGPLCLAAQPVKKINHSEPNDKRVWVQWLDQKLEEKCSVLYVAFGSQAEISNEQLDEIANGLEESMVSFLWVIRKNEWRVPGGFEERVKGRGMVVTEWVDQMEILMHESVEGFLSHCGWNSVLESICAGVPILAWPMMAEQPLNARMVEEELRVGLRVETCDGSVRGFVKSEGLRKTVRELMEGEKGREAREKVRELAVMADNAVQEGGSSWCTMETLIRQACGVKEK